MPSLDLPSGIRIRYDDRGPRGVPVVVLAHGFGVSLEMWMPQMRALSERHRLITWDARGHGGSSAPTDVASYDVPGLAADLRGLLEGLDAVEGAVIGGMSFGGMIALQYAVDHPADTSALILSDSVTRGDGPIPDVSFTGDPGIDGARLAMVARPDLTPALPGLAMPALLIVGDRDQRILDGLPRMAGLPRRRIVRLHGCSHGTSGQRPDAWNDAVLRFLDDVEAGAPLGEDETV